MDVRARALLPRARWLRSSILAALAVVACVVGSGIADDAGATAATGAVTPSVRLVGQTPFIREPSGVLTLTLTRTGPLAHPHATVQLTLYDRLTTRDGLEAAIGQPGPSGVLAQTRPLPARCLPRTATTVGVAVGVAPTGARLTAPKQCAGRAPILRLGCSVGCDGVYPLRVTSRGGGTVVSFVTLVTFATSSATPLRVAWVLRVAGATDGLTESDNVLRALASHPLVPVSLDAQGAAVARGFTTHAGATSLALLRGALGGTAHELLAEAYAPANLGALRASRLNGEVIDQFALTDLVLADADRAANPSLGHLRHRAADADVRRCGPRDRVPRPHRRRERPGPGPLGHPHVGCAVHAPRRDAESHRARDGHDTVVAQRRDHRGPLPRRRAVPR